MYNHIQSCRACGNQISNLTPVFDLGLQPLANDFKTESEEHAGFAPLKVLFCEVCSLAQLSVVIRPDILYSNYPYVTSASEMMSVHHNQLIQRIQAEQPLGEVLEIGSNDGLFLQRCLIHGATGVLGVDPALNLAPLARARGVNTVSTPFSESCARIIGGKFHPNTIIARHVFCHVPDWKDFIRGLEALCGPETVVIIEVPHASSLLRECEFDTVYHEHLSYFTLTAMEWLLRDTGLHIHDMQWVEIHGGSAVVTLRSNQSPKYPTASVAEWLGNESVTLTDWLNFSDRASREISDTRTKIRECLRQGKTVAGYGASAKSTVWLNTLGFSSKEIQYVTDTTPTKVGRFTPGTDIPVVGPEMIQKQRPDYLILFAWNFAAEVLAKEKAYLGLGGQFIIPHERLGKSDKLV